MELPPPASTPVRQQQSASSQPQAHPAHSTRQARPYLGRGPKRRKLAAAAPPEAEAKAPPALAFRSVAEEYGLSVADPDALGLPRTLPVRHLSSQEAMEALYASLQPACQDYYAFYSSELGGVVTDPALMVVHVDDHLVHRGHAVFDTAMLTEGYLYMLEQHLDRFLKNAEDARLTPPYSREQLRRIILETTAASTRYDGSVRYWLGAGRGGFGLSPRECIKPTFYCMVYLGGEPRFPSAKQGWAVCSSSVALKPPQFAKLKSTNYLPNVLCQMEAEARGCNQGIFVDKEGYVAEGPTMNVGVVTHEGELVTPPFESSLPGLTIKRVLQLVAQYYEEVPELQHIKKVSQRPLHIKEAYAAQEVFLVGSSTLVQPVAQWDDVEYPGMGADNAPGKATYAMRGLLMNDMLPEANTGLHTEVPYDTLPLSAQWH